MDMLDLFTMLGLNKVTNAVVSNEIIYSLKEEKDVFELNFSEKNIFEIKFKDWKEGKQYKIPRYKVLEKIANTCIRPKLDDLNEILSIIDENLHPCISITEDVHQLAHYYRGCSKDSPAYKVELQINDSTITALTVLNGILPPKSHWGSITGDYVIDIGMFFAELLLFTSIQKEFDNMFTSDNLDENPSYRNLKKQLDKLKLTTVVLIKSDMKYIFDSVVDILKSNEITPILFDNYKEYKSSVLYINDITHHVVNKSELLPIYGISNQTIPPGIVFDKKTNIHYMIDIYYFFWCNYQKEKKTYEYNRILTGDYARSYMTKKNIPKKIQESMKKSSFNQHFGFVEFDEQCDLEKINIIENQFEELSSIFGQGKLENYEIRFRRLGNHKAAGLYYPTENCMCVDIDSPSSLCHEYWHLLDYRYKRISNRYSFQHILSEYKILVESKVYNSPKLISIWEGKSKYNSSYYLEPTEIFARCGEIYISKVLNLSNSLTKITYNEFYPNNESFCKLLDEFYSNLIKEIKLI